MERYREPLVPVRQAPPHRTAYGSYQRAIARWIAGRVLALTFTVGDRLRLVRDRYTAQVATDSHDWDHHEGAGEPRVASEGGILLVGPRVELCRPTRWLPGIGL